MLHNLSQQGTDAGEQVPPRMSLSSRVITGSKVAVAVFLLVGIAAGVWMYSVAGSLGTDITTTDCALGLAISDTVDSDSSRHFANELLRWEGLKPLCYEGEKIMTLFDKTAEQFGTYVNKYPQGLRTRHMELESYIRMSIYRAFRNRKARSPANELELFAPTAIRDLLTKTENMVNDVRLFAGPALAGSEETYDAARRANRWSVMKPFLNDMEDTMRTLISAEETYWHPKDVRNKIEGHITTSIKAVGIAAVILTSLTLLFLAIAVHRPSSRLAAHFVYNVACLAIVLMLALLVVFLPVVVVMSDSCYAIEDSVKTRRLRGFGLDEGATRLIEFCMFDSGNMAKYYDFDSFLEFAHTLTTARRDLKDHIRYELPTASRRAGRMMEEVGELDSNLHIESQYHPEVDEAVSDLNAMTNVQDPHCRFPNCTRLVDLWKLHPWNCDNESYIINGEFGTPRYPALYNMISCLRVEDWESTLFSSRYTNSSLNCTNATRNIETIKKQFVPIANFAADMHKIHSDLNASIGQYISSPCDAAMCRYKSMLDTTYTEELGVLNSFGQLMLDASALLEHIGDSNSGFLSHINCSILAAHYSCRLRKGGVPEIPQRDVHPVPRPRQVPCHRHHPVRAGDAACGDRGHHSGAQDRAAGRYGELHAGSIKKYMRLTCLHQY